MKEIILKTKKLCKMYKDKLVIDNVNLEIKKGEILGIIGKNKSGKTTLLKLLCGLTIPTSGEIELFNETSSKGLENSRRRTGVIIEAPSFFPYLSARKNLEYYCIQRGIVEKNSIDDVLKIVGLYEIRNEKFKSFSLDMKQRLGLALSIISNPYFLILDEPMNGLDPKGIIEFREILLKLNSEKNMTIIITSHIIEELSQLVGKYGFINNGKFIEQISSRELINKTRKSLFIKVNNPAKAVAIIEKEFGRCYYEISNNEEIKLYDLIDKPEKISKLLIDNNILLYSIKLEGIKIEDYFINLIGDDK